MQKPAPEKDFIASVLGGFGSIAGALLFLSYILSFSLSPPPVFPLSHLNTFLPTVGAKAEHVSFPTHSLQK